MRRLGTWLGIVALALQLAWPLVVAAAPRSVALVPLCTVDGVTHYLEVPTGKAPLEGTAHGEHCPLCCLGHAAPPAADAPSLAHLRVAYDRPAAVLPGFVPWTAARGREARAPPSSLPAD